MEFDQNKFKEYKALLNTTPIQECYQQVIKLLKFISSRLEEEMTEYHFMKRLVENQMDFSYFQLTNENLKHKGLKLQVIFLHRTCQFEVWLSGYNRNIQKNYYEKLQDNDFPFTSCRNPLKNDYILKKNIEKNITEDNIEAIILEIKQTIRQLDAFTNNLKT